jgi:predicted Zn-dependent protease
MEESDDLNAEEPMVRTSHCIVSSGLIAVITLAGWSAPGRAQVPQPEPFEAMRKMFEQFGQQSQQFMPGMFSELTPEQIQRLERVPITPREESAFGEQVLKNYGDALRARQQELVRKGRDVDYLRKLAEKIRPLMKHSGRYAKLDVAVVETDEIEAYSVPGGHLIFTTGMIEDAESEAALVGVIAHELSHLDHGHQLLFLKQQKSLGNIRDMQSGMLWLGTLAKPFRPEFESQADADAAQWMLKAGYDPRELAHLLQRWEVRTRQQAAWTKAIPAFARSHPDSDRRAEAVLAELDRARVNPQRLATGRDNLRTRTPLP